MDIPQTQHAVQLVGPEQIVLNRNKPVPEPGPHQILARTEAVGLCFSDMKLLKQFSTHVRKTEALSGPALGILNEIPSYVPGDKPTVPGHEVTVRIAAVGDRVKHYRVGQRWIVQADYRNLKTAGANCALGYDFEGGLQEYVLMDERVIGDPTGPEGYMIAADEENSASALALVEPWACVERAYATRERSTLKAGGRLLIVADPGREVGSFETTLGSASFAEVARFSLQTADRKALTEIPDGHFDDVVYFGSDPATVEILDDKPAAGGILNIVLGGKKLGKPVSLGIGRAHYGNMRWIGTTGDDPADSYKMVPETGELRPNDRLLVIGAGGPMGQMHVIRALSMGLPGLQVTAADIDDERLATLTNKVKPFFGDDPWLYHTAQSVGLSKGLDAEAKARLADLSGGAASGEAFAKQLDALPEDGREAPVKLIQSQSVYQATNTSRGFHGSGYTYIALMAPVPALVTDGLSRCAKGARLNVFAGIPATVRHPIDMDEVIAKGIYILGTSGSEIDDMKVVYRKLAAGELDTDLSVGAISGMAGAQEGLKAVENRTLDGKIIVYPMLHDLGLIPLDKLGVTYPGVAAKLNHGAWCKAAEDELLRVASR